MTGKLLILDVAALGYDSLRAAGRREINGLTFRPAESVLPAVTCTVQASFRTAAPPASHGMIANGRYFRDLHRCLFWEQSSDLVAGERIWERFRGRGRRVGMLFWQQSLGERVDVLLSPAPIHRHHGGMIQDCYSRPAGLYAALKKRLGEFRLHRYWGPLAGAKAGDWIAAATAEVMSDPQLAPELLLAYLPTLDYDLQRWGPDDPRSAAALAKLIAQIEMLLVAARSHGYDVLVFGDYAIARATEAVFPNRVLAETGLLQTRRIGHRLYADLHASRAFAMVDHEIAHVFVREKTDVLPTAAVLSHLPGVEKVLDAAAQADAGLACPACGDLVLLAREGAWLAYPWWNRKREAPDYASHVDIHNKPGFDPCELFFGWPPPSVSQDASRIRGSHGRAGPGRQIAWAATFDLGQPKDLLALSGAVKSTLDS